MNDRIAQDFANWAPHYDADDERRWTRQVCSAFAAAAERVGPPGRRLLDIGCGTGTSALAFADFGYTVTGCDIAPEMLAIARRKPGADRLRLIVADLRCLPDLGHHDVITAVNDPFSHLLTDDEFRMALRGAARHLAPGGILLFDQHPLTAYLAVCGDATVTERPDHVLIRRTRRDRTSAYDVFTVCLDRFTHTTSDKDWSRTTLRLNLRHRTPEHVDRLVAEAGLEPLPRVPLDATATETTGPARVVLHVARAQHDPWRPGAQDS